MKELLQIAINDACIRPTRDIQYQFMNSGLENVNQR